jgi:hypothetical protein
MKRVGVLRAVLKLYVVQVSTMAELASLFTHSCDPGLYSVVQDSRTYTLG